MHYMIRAGFKKGGFWNQQQLNRQLNRQHKKAFLSSRLSLAKGWGASWGCNLCQVVSGEPGGGEEIWVCSTSKSLTLRLSAVFSGAVVERFQLRSDEKISAGSLLKLCETPETCDLNLIVRMNQRLWWRLIICHGKNASIRNGARWSDGQSKLRHW